MTQRTVFITGASSGIGRALALEFAEHGAHLGLVARRGDELERLASEIRKKGARALVLPIDVKDHLAIKAALAKTDREFGSLDVVIANAGVGVSRHATLLTWEEVARVIDVNVCGAMATLVEAIPILLTQKGGHLVGVSSLVGRRGFPRTGAYSASKAALSTFLETLRIDLARANIRVTDVQPGFVDTSMTREAKHPTPLKWPASRAARLIVRRLDSAPARITFPWQMALLSSLLQHAPSWLFDMAMRASLTPGGD